MHHYRTLLLASAIGLLAALPTAAYAQSPGETVATATDAPPAASATEADRAAAAPQAPSVGAILSDRVRALKAIPAGRDRDDRTALAAFYAARGTGLWIEADRLNARAQAVIAELGKADDWGLTAADFTVPAAPATADAALDAEVTLSLAALKYARHARGGRMDPTQLSIYIDRQPPLMDPARVLAGLAEATAPDAYLQKLHPQHVQFQRLRKLYISLRAGTLPEEPKVAAAPEEEPETKGRKGKAKKKAAPPAPEKLTALKVLYNMEMWRWMPEQLGSTYIQANIPEFMFRVVRDGEVFHSERIITGKAVTQTPMFSDEMELVVFHPSWGVPNSIKVKELLPGLIRGGDSIGRSGLRATYRGREVNPSSINWAQVDIRNVDIIHPPGPSNPLGVVKFLFPNKHDVYMHDTPTKNLFNTDLRTYSHGCVRVRNPVKLAEIVMGLDQGWTPERVAATLKSGKPNNEVRLQNKIPVHITYFTVTVDEAGKPTMFRDIYGNEKLIQMGLEGKTHLIVRKKEDLGAARAQVIGRVADTRGQGKDWLSQLFGGF